ncbi:hypothetical protein DFQ27_003576 [Actinomortierella ambigua]|uniref:Uncharacterized protein n=1 Tax=Actinomortierella ambigua TaxID=1343610 RepID=A0A9P6Q8Q4_9FUNG|nr:hypothetical protein DFQ27_003576 [Actinomortierella ambigua]
MTMVQKQQGLKPDRPDVLVKVQDQEVVYGEVTGLCQEKSGWKNNWGLYRLARFDRALLDEDYYVAPLIQDDLERYLDKPNPRKRSWRLKDIPNAKKRLT